MKLPIALASLVLTVCASTAQAQEVPLHCKTPQLIESAKINIPILLGVNASYITHIKVLDDAPRVPIYYSPTQKAYRIECYLRVEWSNGHIDIVGKFTQWVNPYGQMMVSYTP